MMITLIIIGIYIASIFYVALYSTMFYEEMDENWQIGRHIKISKKQLKILLFCPILNTLITIIGGIFFMALFSIILPAIYCGIVECIEFFKKTKS